MLEGVRVVDLSRDPGAAYAARMFALLGANGVKVEPPEGDLSRRRGPRRDDDGESSALSVYLNAAKRSAVLDSAVDAKRTTLLRLIGHADVVFEDGAPGWWKARGIDFATLTATHPRLVVVSVTPFGQDGPRAGWRATALTAHASGGQLALSGDPDAPPLKVAGQQAYYQGGLHAFSAALTALFAVRRDGLGDWIDLSLQEVQAASLEAAGPVSMVREFDTGRAGNQARAVWGIYPCADGYVGVASMARQTGSVYRCIEHPELAEDPRFADLINNPEMNEIASMLIEEWTMARGAQEIFEASQRHRAPFSLIPTPRDLLDWAPLRASGFWSEVAHPRLGTHPLPGAPFTLNGERARATRPAPLLGEHTAEVTREAAEPAPAAPASNTTTRLPFEGLRVLDLSQVWAGPYAARFLADMGADVIHIEGPGFPDAVRGLMRTDDPRSFNKATYFNEYNRNKRGLALDLHRPEGMEAFKRLVPLADVVIENWSVGVSERLGMGYDELRALNPRIVFVQMPGFSKELPESERVGFGPTIEQMGGLVALQGYEDGPPHKSGISYGDPIGGIVAAGATALGLWRREGNGEGCQIVVSQRDNVIGMVGEFMAAEALGIGYPVRDGNRDPDAAPHNVYRTRDDAGRGQGDALGRPVAEFHDTWVAVAVDSDEAWRMLRGVVHDARLDDPAYDTLAGRKAAETAIDTVIGEWARGRDASAVAAALQAAGVAACPVLTPLMLVRDAHLAARGNFPTTVHPEAGEVRTSRPVWRMARRPTPRPAPAPTFGQHNREVLRDLAGYSNAEVDAFETNGITATVPTRS